MSESEKCLRIVVTGATSMVGLALIRCYLQKESNICIFAIIREKTNKRNLLPIDDRLHIVECNIDNYRDLESRIPKCDIFYHFAWPRTLTYQENADDVISKSKNVVYLLEAMQLAKSIGCRKFIGAGTQAEYGMITDDVFSPDTMCNPVRADGIAHFAAGKLAKIMAQDLDIDFVWVRIFSVYGINDRENSMIMTTINKLMRNEHCAFTRAEQMWDYLYEDDIAEAFYLIGKKSTGSKTYCVGYGKGIVLKRYVETIRDIVNPNAILGFGEIDYPNNPVMKLVADISELTKDTGWIPKTEFRDGIRKIYLSKLAMLQN